MKLKYVLKLAPVLFFTLFMGNFSYGLLKEKPPLKVVIIDTGVSNVGYTHMCPDGHKSFSPSASIKDHTQSKHGTNIAAIIEKEGGPGNWCFIMVKFADKEGDITFQDYMNALEYAASLKPALLNLSLTGRNKDAYETQLIKQMINAGTQVVAAAGNDGEFIPATKCDVYPACVDSRVYVVGNSGSKSSNKGPFVDTFINGENVTAGGITLSGTSQSAATFTGRVIRKVMETY